MESVLSVCVSVCLSALSRLNGLKYIPACPYPPGCDIRNADKEGTTQEGRQRSGVFIGQCFSFPRTGLTPGMYGTVSRNSLAIVSRLAI